MLFWGKSMAASSGSPPDEPAPAASLNRCLAPELNCRGASLLVDDDDSGSQQPQLLVRSFKAHPIGFTVLRNLFGLSP